MLTPYYDRDGVTLYLGDCREILPQIETHPDLILTSPPYDNLRTYGGHQFDFPAIASAIVDLMSVGSVLVWVVGDGSDESGESGNSFRQALRFKELGLRLHDTMIYEKNGPSYPSQDKYYQTFEYMFVLSSGRPKTVNLLDDRPNRWYGQKWSKVRSRRGSNDELVTQTWVTDTSQPFGVRFNIWRYNVGAGYSAENEIAYQHPAIFPLQMAKDHICSWSNPNDLVLDPMSGSGTTLVAAQLMNRRAVGIEINEDYLKIAIERLRQGVLL